MRCCHVPLCNRCGSFAIFAAIRRASSLLSNLAADRSPRLILEIDIRELLPVVVAHDKAGVQLFDGPGRREAACYSITSSARTSRDDGTVMPRALAVLRLTDRIILVGNSTGRSPGRAPWRILSTKEAERR
jgi:hypothetical protein